MIPEPDKTEMFLKRELNLIKARGRDIGPCLAGDREFYFAGRKNCNPVENERDERNGQKQIAEKAEEGPDHVEYSPVNRSILI